MANGVLASFQSATTKYSHDFVDQAANPNGLVRADFPMYTCPGATIASGSLRIMNTSGAAVTVDVAIQDYTCEIQFAAPSSQSPQVNNWSEFGFVPNQDVTSSALVVSSHNGTAFVVGETITLAWSSPNPPVGATQTGTVVYWDAANLKLWWKDPVGEWPTTVASNMTVTGAGGGSASVDDSYVGTWGRCVAYDRLAGQLLVQNNTLVNNVKSNKYTLLNEQRVSGIIGAGQLSVSSRAYAWLPSLSTVTLYNSSNTGGVAQTAEWKETSGNAAEVVISAVSYSNDQNKILKNYSIPNNSEVSLTGLVLEQWQNLYVNASAGATFNFIGFEEATTITSA